MNDVLESISADFANDLQFVLSNVTRSRHRRLILSELDNLEINLIDETRQKGGSFKYRGAVLGVNKYRQGVVASGSGNFPIAVGLAASNLSVQALLVMPDDAPQPKKELARQSGSEVIFGPRTEFTRMANAEAARREWATLHPFRNPEMLIGSFSLGQEIAGAIKQHGTPSDAVVVACGGGGLAAGTALGLLMGDAPNTTYVVEPEHYPRLSAAFAAGAPTVISPTGATICDAVRVTQIGELAFDTLKKLDVVVTTASDAAVVAAQRLMAEECQIYAEPSGALALASVLEGRLQGRHDRLWVVVCGGNS